VAAAAAEVVGLAVVAGAAADVVGGAEVAGAEEVAPEDAAGGALPGGAAPLEIGLPTQLVSWPELMVTGAV
jgi:hypothetical protein